MTSHRGNLVPLLMVETRYAPSIARLIGIAALLSLPFAALSLRGAGPTYSCVAIVLIVALVFYAGRAHTVVLGRDFIEAHGQKVALKDVGRASIRGFIGDVYASDSARIGVSSVFLSRGQRSEISRRLAAVSKS